VVQAKVLPRLIESGMASTALVSHVVVSKFAWYDFVFDHCANGQQLKCLTVTDEFTKEGLAIDVDGRIRSARVIEVLSHLVSARGAPRFLRSDNGPEFVSKALLSWIVAQGIGMALIEPGKPWQRVRGSRSKASALPCNGPGRCGMWGLRAPARCSIVPSRTNAANRGSRLKLTVVRRNRAGQVVGSAGRWLTWPARENSASLLASYRLASSQGLVTLSQMYARRSHSGSFAPARGQG
jgi:transposase InsO family protein